MIRAVKPKDAAAIAEIYNHYIQYSCITFEEVSVSAIEMRKRISHVLAKDLPWLVAELDGMVIGYAYATKWRERSAYRHSVETTVYLSHDAKGNGIGGRLYKQLFTELRDRGVRIAIGGITQPSLASVALHEKLGMKKVAHFERVGLKFNQWLDVGYWQIDLSE